MSRDLLAQLPVLRRWAFRCAFAVTPVLPWRLGQALGYAAGWLAWVCDARGRRTVARNLGPLIGQREAPSALVRRNYVHFLWLLNDTFRIHCLPSGFPAPRVVDPWGLLASRPVGGPLVACTVHANWELLLALTHRHRILSGSRAIALGTEDPHLDRLFERMRAAAGCRSLLLDWAPLAALRALRRKRVLCIVGDRNYGSGGVRANLLGRQVLLPVGPAALAVQTGAPVVCVLLARRRSGSYTLYIDRLLYPDGQGARSAQTARLAQRIADCMGRFLRHIPEQWVAFHPVW